MTEDQLQSLVSSLRSMFDKIGRKEPIAQELVEITRLQGEIQATAPPQLAHFLERRSYTKALEFLEAGVVTDDPDRPACDDELDHP